MPCALGQGLDERPQRLWDLGLHTGRVSAISEDKAIRLWAWDEAPEVYRGLSTHGGDEDGVALIPKGVEIPWWLERLWSVYGDADIIETDEGQIVIWAHA